jgi:twitching motility protein PilT
MMLDALLAAVKAHGASDLLLHEGEPARLRMSDGWVRLEGGLIPAELLQEVAQRGGIDPSKTDADGALVGPEGGRFRLNWHRACGRPAAVLRRVREEIPGFLELGLPGAILQNWASRPQGLVLFCGPTGSGKSTSVAASLQWINQHQARHVVTVEDPIEYLFRGERAIFTQREIGIDVPSFGEGLRRALRQSPEVIFVGEMRDMETARIALQAAETGHLVYSTLHVSRAVEAVARLALLFPEGERELLRQVLARELVGVFGQRLVPGVDESGRVLVAEFFANEGLVGKCLEAGDGAQLSDWIERAPGESARSLTRAFLEELAAGKITAETALAHAPDPSAIQRSLRGLR